MKKNDNGLTLENIGILLDRKIVELKIELKGYMDERLEVFEDKIYDRFGDFEKKMDKRFDEIYESLQDVLGDSYDTVERKIKDHEIKYHALVA